MSGKISMGNYTCSWTTKNWTHYYKIRKNWHEITRRYDRDDPKKSAKFSLVLDYINEKKYNEMLKFYKKTNDYRLAWKLLKKTEIYEKLENEKNLLLAKI